MQLFYVPGISGEFATLDQAESHHCIKVLRKVHGDDITLVDGSGSFYDAVITDDNPKRCTVKILKQRITGAERDYQLHIAIAPTKNTDRFEWFLEKATEIGIDIITPLVCQRSERHRLRYDRMEGILVSAMKQSVKARKPVLNTLIKFEDFMAQDFTGTNCFVAHCIEDESRTDLLKAASKGKNFLILVGPEGDFTSSEVGLAIRKGFAPVTLGNSRLRTETAGVVASQIICDKVSIMK